MQEGITLLFGDKLPAPIQGALGKLLLLDRFNELYDEVRRKSGGQSFVELFLETMHVRPAASDADLALVPKSGPVVAVANHPFGLVEGAVLAAMLGAVRSDVKILANHLLASLPEARKYCIFVDPFGEADSIRMNLSGLKSSIAWLRQGGLLGIFPAGEVAHLNLKERAVVDPEWNHNIARLIRLTGATVLPVYFLGANSALFQLLGFLHPRVRTALLPHELLNKHHRPIELRIGKPIGPEKVRSFQDDVALTRYLRHRTYLLKNREAVKPARRFALEVSAPAGLGVAESMAREIAQLGQDRVLAESGDFQVLLGKAIEMPSVLEEIGRLREIAFRTVGEGTGESVDLDSFDRYYWHLFVWNRMTQEVVSAYRLGPSDEIVERRGPGGLYTNQLFAWKSPFLERIQPALELGRSFVRVEYQKTFAPLLLLWRGIGQFLVRNPKYRVLFGPVSISADYTRASRQLMVGFLNTYHQSPDLARLVAARNPFRVSPKMRTHELVSTAVWDIEELSALIADIEIDRKGVPILLKQYLKLGGELVAFNVDRNFSNALDGLIVVDLHKTDPRVLQRYMGVEGAASYLGYAARGAVVGSGR
jgi:putative hemolysin